jgi:hypothetical protein
MSEHRTVGPIAARKALIKAFDIKQPIFVWGAPGIGKSETIAQIGKDTNSLVIDVRLSLWDPTDIKGVPYFDDKSGTMKWAPPSELPSMAFAKGFERIILFLDELNSAAPSVQQAAYQLVLDRKVGTYTLPDNVVIVAAGNRESDRGVTYRMPAPLSNRFVHIEMSVSFDDWFVWATNNNIHKNIIGFLNWSKSDLYSFDPKSNFRAFATPRSWSFVNKLIADDNMDDETATTLITGAVGEGVAIKFSAYQRLADKLPNPSDILSGSVKKLKDKEISAMYALTIGLCYELKDSFEKEHPLKKAHVNNFFEFIMANFETELVIMAVRVAINTYKLPLVTDDISCFSEFSAKYSKYITRALA